MKRLMIVAVCLVFVILLSACTSNSNASVKVEDIRAICELATLQCYYNNVAKIDKKADNFFQKDRKMWIEYEGEATIGIDMSKVIIDLNGDTVTVTLPNAEIQSIKPLSTTLTEDSYIISSDGWLIKNKITVEDQQDAIAKGQEAMKQAILENDELFRQAEEQAKELITSYINQIGKVANVEYKIIWKS